MLRLIATRFALGVLTLLAVSVLIFICTQILPGDVASAVLGQQATPESLKVFRAELGLDKPAYLRYLTWLFGVLHGDFGKSLTNQRVIVEELGPRFVNTLFLAGYAALHRGAAGGRPRHPLGDPRGPARPTGSPTS